MILTTTNSIEGFKIADYLGIVTGVVVDFNKMALTASKLKQSYKNTLNKAKEEAFQELSENARQLNANAVVGIKVEVEYTSMNYPIVSVIGTAVKVAV